MVILEVGVKQTLALEICSLQVVFNEVFFSGSVVIVNNELAS